MCRLSSEMSDETTVLIRRPGRILLHDPQDEGRPLAVYDTQAHFAVQLRQRL